MVQQGSDPATAEGAGDRPESTPAAQAAPPASAPEDAEILFSDETITIGKEQIVVREFRYLEGLAATPIARPIIQGLRELVAHSGDFEPEALDELIATNRDAWLELVSMSTGKPVEWIAGLRDRAGTDLSLAFWRVNGPFFTRRLQLATALAAGLARLSRSRKFSRSSSPPASAETITTSASG